MTSLEVLDRVIAVLDDAGIEHMLVGAFSAIAYGLARATKDADFVVACEPRRIAEIAATLGPEFTIEKQIEFETFTHSKRNVVAHGPSGFTIEFFYLNPDPHHQERFQRRRRGMISPEGRGVWLPTAEDVIIQKLRWQREKDITDARNVIAVSAGSLDWEYLRRWTEQHGTAAMLARLRQEAAGGLVDGESGPHFPPEKPSSR
jgi:hypothetical protein